MEANLVYLKDEWKGNDIFLLGTMHVSEESAKEVQRVWNHFLSFCDFSCSARRMSLKSRIRL